MKQASKLLLYSFLIINSLLLINCQSETPSTTNETQQVGETTEPTIVELTPSHIKNTGIEWQTPSQRNLKSVLQVNGMVDVPPQNLVSVAALMGGFVRKTELLQGMRVQKGQVLVVLQNPEYVQLQQDYLDNKAKLIFAEEEFKRQTDLQTENINARKTLQQALATLSSLKAVVGGLSAKLTMLGFDLQKIDKGELSSSLVITSPIAGYITTVNINIGKFIHQQDEICQIIDTDHLHAELRVFEKDIYKIKEGQKVRFYLVNQPEMSYTGSVYLINKQIETTDRTVRIHAHFDKSANNLLPNTFIKAMIEIGENTVPALPEVAFVTDGGKTYVFVVKGQKQANTLFELTEVQKGVTENGYTELLFLDNKTQISSKLEVVVKGSNDLLAKLRNIEEE